MTARARFAPRSTRAGTASRTRRSCPRRKSARRGATTAACTWCAATPRETTRCPCDPPALSVTCPHCTAAGHRRLRARGGVDRGGELPLRPLRPCGRRGGVAALVAGARDARRAPVHSAAAPGGRPRRPLRLQAQRPHPVGHPRARCERRARSQTAHAHTDSQAISPSVPLAGQTTRNRQFTCGWTRSPTTSPSPALEAAAGGAVSPPGPHTRMCVARFNRSLCLRTPTRPHSIPLPRSGDWHGHRQVPLHLLARLPARSGAAAARPRPGALPLGRRGRENVEIARKCGGPDDRGRQGAM